LPRCVHCCSSRASPAGEAAASTRQRAGANKAGGGIHAAGDEHDDATLNVDSSLGSGFVIGEEGGAEA
jgi:hypothetical protein